ncbi:MAG: fasciclin domain-containing protein [Pseudomonadota bacterium]
MEPETITEIAAGNDNFDILVTALSATGLDATLNGLETDVTVFAPTDDAFAALAVAGGFTGDVTDEAAVTDAILGLAPLFDEDGDVIQGLTNVLLYHVVGEPLTAAEIAALDSVTTLLEGATITPNGATLIDLEPDLLDPTIVIPDIEASDGFIQAIDRVLVPADLDAIDLPSIVDIASGNDAFNILTNVVVALNLAETLANDDGEFTVFAPTDAAFTTLATDLGFEGDTADEQAVTDFLAAVEGVGDIVLYHVLGEAETVDALGTGGTRTALSGAELLVDGLGVADLDLDNGTPLIIDELSDIAASNGFVHAVDSVLRPIDLPQDAVSFASIPEAVIAISGDDGFDDNGTDLDILLQALIATGAVDLLSDPESEFTVFAPSDQAFIDLVTALGVEVTTEQETFDALVSFVTGLAGSAEGGLEVLTSILEFHVAQGGFGRVDLADSPALTTLLGNTGPVTTARTIVDADTDIADPAFTPFGIDVVAGNSIIQSIDSVILPVDLDEALATGSDGDDSFTTNPGTVSVDGGDGFDTLTVDEEIGGFQFGNDTSGLSIEGDSPIALSGIDQIDFLGGTSVNFDDGETASGVNSLYQFALGRQADPTGAAFYAGVADEAGLLAVAQDIVSSAEFAGLFDGVLDSSELVTFFYENGLGREADEAGLTFWTGVLGLDGDQSGDLLLSFATSDEFQTANADLLDNGLYVFDA